MVRQACVKLRAVRLPDEWAGVEALGRDLPTSFVGRNPPGWKPGSTAGKDACRYENQPTWRRPAGNGRHLCLP